MSDEQLPRGWRWARFREVATIASNLVDPRSTPHAIHIAPNHIESWSGVLLGRGTVEGDEVRSAKHAFGPGQILYSKIRPYLAKAVLVDFSGLCSADMYPVDADPTTMDPRFLLAWMLTPEFTEAASGRQGRTVLPKINQSALNELQVPVAPLDEQRRIVAKLDALRARSRKVKEALDAVPALLDRLRQSILAAAFRGDLTADWREQNPDVEPASELLKRIRVERRKRWEEAQLAKLIAKGKPPKDDRWKAKYVEPEPVDDSDLPELPDGWCWATVNDLVFDIDAGVSFRCDERPPMPGEVGVAKVSAVTWGAYDEAESKTCTDGARINEDLFVCEGDFLVSRANTIELVGAAVIAEHVTSPVMLSDKILRLRNASEDAKHWLLWMLRSSWGRAQIEGASTGNQLSMRNISQAALRGIPLPIPPVHEMQAATEVVTSALRSASALGGTRTDCAEALTSLDAAILAAAFRGELVEREEPSPSVSASPGAAR